MSVLNRFSLMNRNALVTGAGQGIGRALAVALAEAGANVAVVDRNGETAKSTAQEIGALGVESLAIETDVTQTDEVNKMVDQVTSKWGPLNIAVNNAGIAIRSPAESIPDDDWDAVLNVNLKAVYLCCRAEAQVMLEQKSGSIINLVSMSAQVANRPQLHAHYNASKAGALQLTRSCAAEWANRGVRINSISPGHMLTPMTENCTEEEKAQWIANTPMGRNGEPSDLQGAVVFLASDAASYITGHDLVVDGGYTLW
jgi:NAD(P)-dependent dehydrogenase (short-subunit alcohol dehydrogenase family)